MLSRWASRSASWDYFDDARKMVGHLPFSVGLSNLSRGLTGGIIDLLF